MAESRLKLNLYCSSNPGSKSYWAFDALENSWPYGIEKHKDDLAPDGIHVFWGLVGQNAVNIREAEKRKQPYVFIDMPYWGRWMPGTDPKDSMWRVIANGLHVTRLKDHDNKRSGHIELKPRRTAGEYVLVCPSSFTLNHYHKQPNWLQQTLDSIKSATDLPIKVREKPRSGRTSGPSVATVPLDLDLERAYCTVTMASIVGVDSLIQGVPNISSPFSPTSAITDHDMSNIEHLRFDDRSNWINTLSYNQWSISEIDRGLYINSLLENIVNGQ